MLKEGAPLDIKLEGNERRVTIRTIIELRFDVVKFPRYYHPNIII